ncbi:hypothetical protein BpHYR1_013774 [Brachionus plicatilis]|uniref:Uncharacterized protein n=1 Tax=Brachionus plicatilis TaxID=10195 RepID=A0A3M7RAH0_BRAPC|nr:hypothetical protein BpHYR1_013774 [Brachionus plicatilis]
MMRINSKFRYITINGPSDKLNKYEELFVSIHHFTKASTGQGSKKMPTGSTTITLLSDLISKFR